MDRKGDSILVADFLNGDESSYVELISRYSDKVFNLALRLTRNREDAEEVLQDAFVTVYHKLASFEGKSAFSSWLYRITVNTAFMLLRKRKQHQAISIEDVSPQDRESWAGNRSENNDISFMSSRHELKATLESAISKLPDDYRAIFLLRDVDGLSNQEVGDVMGLSVPAVKSRLHRSRSLLRKRLNKYYNDYVNDDVISYGSYYQMAANA